jgi:hypothetical protein
VHHTAPYRIAHHLFTKAHFDRYADDLKKEVNSFNSYKTRTKGLSDLEKHMHQFSEQYAVEVIKSLEAQK